MVFIKLSDIKANTFDLDALIEESFNDGLQTLILSLENMKSALFFKEQKLTKNLQSTSSQEFPINFLNQINSLNIQKQNTFLKKNSEEILKTKTMIKILTIKKQISEENFSSLNDALESDNFNDWEFLSYFFLTFDDLDLKQKFINLMVDKFEKFLNLNTSLLKKIIEIMNRLDSIDLLVNIYLINLPIYENIKEIKNDKIDITKYENKNLNEFLTKIEESFKNENFLLFEKNFKIKIIEKLFNENISTKIDIFLDEENGFLFLLKFQDCYEKIQFLSKKFKIYDLNIEIQNLFEHHKSQAIRKEIECLDLLFKILKGEKFNTKYFFNQKVLKKEKIFDNFLIFLIYFDKISERKNLFNYEKSNKILINNKFFKCLDQLLEVSEDFEGLKVLSEIFLVLKKYLKKFDFEFLEEKMEKIYQREMKNSLKEQSILVKKITKQNLRRVISKMIENIEIVKENTRKYLKGKNGINFLCIYLEALQKIILNFLNSQTIRDKEIRAFEIFSVEFAEQKIEDVLSDIISVVTCDEKILKSAIKISKLHDNELKKWLKLRDDYKKVKADVL